MSQVRVGFTRKSKNTKTGPMPVSTTVKASCPGTCPLKRNGCYAEHGPLGMYWAKLSAGDTVSLSWDEFCGEIAALRDGQIWRHNQAGDLPHNNGKLDRDVINALVDANNGKRGFTYTHHNVDDAHNADVVRKANQAGFTINVSANNLQDAENKLTLGIGPVVTVLPADVQGKQDIFTPYGARVIVCPATYRDDVSCASCGLCQRQRDVIVGFPAHGNAKKRATTVALSN